MLQHVIENIKKAGITRAVVNVHHFAGKVIDFLDRNGNFGIDIAMNDLVVCREGSYMNPSGRVAPLAVSIHPHNCIISLPSADTLFIAISDESDRLLDTGGGLLKARTLLDGDEPILLHNADILTDLDLRLMKMRGDATLLVGSRGSSRRLVFGR